MNWEVPIYEHIFDPVLEIYLEKGIPVLENEGLCSKKYTCGHCSSLTGEPVFLG